MGSIHITHDEHVTVVTIDDVKRYNAISMSMWISLKEAFDEIDENSNIRAVILRGAGEKAFVSGANINEFETQRSSEASVAHYNQTVGLAEDAIKHCRVPVIAAISGICYGGGLSLALCCDLRYASPSAKFRMPAARLGLGYGYHGIKAIIQNLGPAKTAEVFFTANVYAANEAAQIGIVNRVHDDVFKHCADVALNIAQNAPLTIKAAKRAMICIAKGDETQIASIQQDVDECFKSRDYAEGQLAFAQKRPPNFTGY